MIGPKTPKPAPAECAVDDCTRAALCAVGADHVCLMHYKRWKRRGSFEQGRAYSAANPDKRPCSAVGCTSREDGASGYCKKHGTRVRRHGDPERVVLIGDRAIPRGMRHPSWAGEHVTYGGAHQRVRAVRGAASDHACACGARAAHWAYRHDDPDEKQAPEGPYSTDPARYDAMCVSCHKRFDIRRSA